MAAALQYVTRDALQAENFIVEAGGLTEEQTRLVMKLFSFVGMPAPEFLRNTEKLKKEL